MEMVMRPARGFKRKTIAAAIDGKIKQWIKTIDDQELRSDIERDYIVTGGAITSMLLGELPNDYDVYFVNVQTCEKVAKYYTSRLKTNDTTRVKVIAHPASVEIRIKSAGIANTEEKETGYDYFEVYTGEEDQLDSESRAGSFIKQFAKEDKQKYEVAMVSSNAITLTDDIQIITRFCGDPETIHENFDFVHTTNSYARGRLILRPEALEATLAKELRYIGSRFPLTSIFRMKKFIKRGWTITAGETLKIMYDVAALNLNDVGVLQEQLTGVDVAYFNELINRLGRSDKAIDRTYLFELINRVFDDIPDDEIVIGR